MLIKHWISLLGLLALACLSACGPIGQINQTPTAASPARATQMVATRPVPSPTPAKAAKPTIVKTVEAQQLAVQPGVQAVSGTYQFAEGPEADGQGNVFFSDVNAGKIYKWSGDGSVSVFISGLNRPNGLEFDRQGNLIVCEGGSGRLISLDAQGQISMVVDQFEGKRFNEPNDLWIDAQGGIYFTDPAYQAARTQPGEYVYYISPGHDQVARVIDNLVRPNGIQGSADGKALYVADHGGGKIVTYQIDGGGVLSNPRDFVASGSDGMTFDASGNLYLTTPAGVQVYDSTGKHLRQIALDENPTNVTFTKQGGQTLFITARTKVYTAAVLEVGGKNPSVEQSSGSFKLTSPVVSEGGVLPVEYTCDGASSTLALVWSGAPQGTQSYAVIMHHVAAPDDVHWYWVLYDIPVDVTSLSKNSLGIGTLGTNSVNGKTAYTPPCSKGPGSKKYTYTVYALSKQPTLSVPADKVNRAALLEAMRDITLASTELNVTYSRK